MKRRDLFTLLGSFAKSEAAAQKLGLTIQLGEARSLDDLPKAFDAMVKTRAQAVAVNAEGCSFRDERSLPNWPWHGVCRHMPIREKLWRLGR